MPEIFIFLLAIKGFQCRIMYLDKHCYMYLDIKDSYVKQICHLSEGVDIVPFVLCLIYKYDVSCKLLPMVVFIQNCNS